MKKFFALIVTAVTLLSIVAAPLAGAAPFLTDPNGLTAGARDAQTLDEALNVEGGELTFFNGDSDNALDWSIDIDAAKSSNRDLDSSKSNVSTTVFAQAGQILEFSYRVMSQQDCDFLIFYSNGQEIARWSGIMNYYAPLEKFVFPIPSSGEYTFSWVYEKDGQYSESWDTAWLDEVRVFDMIHVESIAVDEPREIPENGKYKLKYTVLPENATEKAVTFASSDPSVAAVSEDGTVTGVSEGCAEITVTSVDGGISSAVTVTVTNDARFANLYAYIQYDPIGGNQDFIAHFTDLAPDIIEHVLDIPDCPAVRPGTSSAAVAGNYVYGYTKPGIYSGDFYIIDLTTWEITFPAGEEAGDYLVYDMAYDHERQRMFAMATHYGSDFWLVEVDRRDGSITTIAEMNTLGKNAWGFTIDSEGNAYTILASDTGSYDRTDTGKLASVNLETGECSIIADTGIPTYFANTMEFDHDNQCIYWCNSLSNGLYILDYHTGETEFCGGLYNGGDYMAMFLPNDLEVSDPEQPTEPTPVPPTDTPEPTPVPPTDTPEPTPVPPTDTPEPTPVPPTDTPEPTPVSPTNAPEPTPVPPTDAPEPTPVPGTGAVSLIGLSIAVIAAGAGIITLRKKHE